MENVNEKPCGLVARISTLLNNEVCSDVVFQVRHNNDKKMFYAHSAVLIVAGNRFPDLPKQTSQPKVIKVLDFSPQIVEMMLRYLYTDEINILSMENAVELYKLARVYGIDDLEKVCSNYITKEEVNIDNLFVKYESALSCNFPKLLEKCRDLVQSETKAVFASRYFGEAPFAVVEDIFSLDNLSVSTELDVVQAALRWSACECRRIGRPTEKLCLRAAIEPLLKHLRFLAFSADEFLDFVSKDGNIFTVHETSVLTRKILQPEYAGEFPNCFCRISKPRQPYQKGISNNKVGMNNYSDFYSEPFNKNTFKDYKSEPVNKTTVKDTYSEQFSKTTVRDPDYESVNKNTLKDPYSGLDNIKQSFQGPHQRTSFNTSYSDSGHRSNFNDFIPQPVPLGKSSSNYNPGTMNGNLSYKSANETVNSVRSGQGDAMFYRQTLEKSPLFPKVEQKPFFQYNQKKSMPMLKVLPVSQPSRQTFDFPLQELRKDMRFAFQKDIKCNVKIHMRTGAILIHGIELKIAEEKHNPDESFEVYSCISNNNPSKIETYTLELKNSMLSIMYLEPVRVALGNPADIEITIEDLHLNRCFVCDGRPYELNSGLNCKAEISVKSNQSNGPDNILYLINRIIYSCTS